MPVTAPATRPSALSIQNILSGTSHIEIRANQPVEDYKAIRLTNPDRLIIDIAGTRIQQKPKSITINKFGVAKARIGVSPKNIRIVFDSDKVGFPAHTITNDEDGLRINFK